MKKLTARLLPAGQDLSQVLLLDAPVTTRVRVRSWFLRGARIGWRPTAHNAVEVSFVECGALVYTIGRREHVITPGSAIIVPAHIEHATTIETGTRSRSMWLGPDMVEEIAATMSCAVMKDPLIVSKARRLGTLTGLIAEEASTEGSGKIIAVEALSESLTVDFLRYLVDDRPPAAIGPRDPRIHAALSLIDQSFAEPLSVDDLARAAMLSRFHFSRLFREQVGMSPYQYLVKVRVERAAELLRTGRRSVTEAALSVGFPDLSRFSRAFAQRFGCNPSEMIPTSRRVTLMAL